MLRIFLSLLFSCFFIFNSYSQSNEKFTNAKGGVILYGGTFKINEPEYITTLFPPNSSDFVSKRTISHIYEGLVKFNDATLEIKPCLAELWNLSADQ